MANLTVFPVLSDDEAIKTHIITLINLEQFDKPFHPNIYTGIQSLVFENFTLQNRIVLEKLIKNAIDTYEPRVKLNGVKVDKKIDSVEVKASISYTIIKTQKADELTMTIKRVH